MTDGSVFTGSHFKVQEIVEINYWWARGMTVTNVAHETGHSSKTVVDWYNFHRVVCAQYLSNNNRRSRKGGGNRRIKFRKEIIQPGQVQRWSLGIWW